MPFASLADSSWWAASGPGTFTSGDTLTVELSLSIWDRLDGSSALSAARNRQPPTEVQMLLTYDDTAETQFTPVATVGFAGKLGGAGAFRGRLGS